jgi:predicted nucleic acid-binding protein
VLQLYRSLGKILRVTTDAILIESCNSFSKTTLRALAVALMENIKRAEQLGILEIIHVCEEHISQAWELFKTCMDKEWSLTDCINTNALNKMTSPSPSPLEGEGWVGGKKI